MAERFRNPFPQFLSDSITVLPGALVNFYSTGTGNRKDTFSAQSGDSGTENENPVVADKAGRVPDIFLDGTYRVVLTNSAGIQIWEADPVGGDVTGNPLDDWNETLSYSIDDLVTASDGGRYQSLVDDNLNSDPASEANPASWEKILFIRIYNANVTYLINDATRASDGEDYQLTSATSIGNDPTTDNAVNWRRQTLTPVVTAAAKLFAYRNF